jgi:hypothetical protein
MRVLNEILKYVSVMQVIVFTNELKEFVPLTFGSRTIGSLTVIPRILSKDEELLPFHNVKVD